MCCLDFAPQHVTGREDMGNQAPAPARAARTDALSADSMPRNYATVTMGWETAGGGPPVVRANEGGAAEHRCTCVFAHGLGNVAATYAERIDRFLADLADTDADADADGGAEELAGMARLVRRHCRFVYPAARELPVGKYGGDQHPAWYDEPGDGTSGIGNARAPAGFAASVKYIHAVLHREAAALPAGRGAAAVCLSGFSQGGTMAMMAGLTCPLPLGALVAMSGALCSEQWLRGSAAVGRTAATPFDMVHGAADDVVLPEWAAQSRAVVAAVRGEDAAAAPALHMFDGARHEVTRAMFCVWLRRLAALCAAP
jgi:predicted esterase